MDHLRADLSRADHEQFHRPIRSIDKMVAVSSTGRKTSELPFYQFMVVVLVTQTNLAPQNIHEFVFAFVPVPPGTRRTCLKEYMIDAELDETNSFREVTLKTTIELSRQRKSGRCRRLADAIDICLHWRAPHTIGPLTWAWP